MFLKYFSGMIFLTSEKTHSVGVNFLTFINLDYPFSALCLLKNSIAFVYLNAKVLV